MPQYVQLTSSIELYEGYDADTAADDLNEALTEYGLEHPAVVRMWVSTLPSDQPLPSPIEAKD